MKTIYEHEVRALPGWFLRDITVNMQYDYTLLRREGKYYES